MNKSRYFLLRLGAVVPTLLGISLLCFILVQLTPGGPVEQTIAGWRQGTETSAVAHHSNVTEEQRRLLKEYFGFDKPLLRRYVEWMGKLTRLDLGESYYYGETVWQMISRCLPVSLTFGLVSFLATYGICIPLGIKKAVTHGGRLDTFTSVLVFFLYSIPPFALGLALVVLFGGGSFWSFFPIGGSVSENFDELSFLAKGLDFAHHMFLPLLCYILGSFATVTLMMRDSLLEQLKQDYVTTARAKGLPEKQVIRHARRNALLPIASSLGNWLPHFFAGSLLIETVFGLQGLGRLSYFSIVQRDYPVVLAIIMLLSVAQIVGSLLADYLYAFLDPRIEFA